MSQIGARSSGSTSEEHARSSASPSAASPAPPSKLRSCVVCRSRKVRCDRLSPCSNCRRANIDCVFPSNNRPPRWARRLERITKDAASAVGPSQDADPGTGQVMERLRNLENLVKELSGQLEQANAAAVSSAGGSSGINSPGNSCHELDADHQMSNSSTASATNVQNQFGRLVLQDASRSRYVSSGFWSRVDDELNGLKADTRELAGDDSDTSDDEDSIGKMPSAQELERTPSERNAFFFRHNLGATSLDLRKLHPLPSQIPFLLNVYSENVNLIIQVVHMPSITKTIRELRGPNISSLTPANEALMFSVYYAAVTSLEEDDVIANFGSTKAELNLRYRLGLEHALAKADFLNVPDMVLVQAITIFLFLVRRHDSPRFVWMMTGLVIRMAQALGLHRDGSHFESLTPFQVEMRRRVWWALCMLDVRASEDQGTDFTIASGSFDTKLPLNINDTDIDPTTKETPSEHFAITDMTFAIVCFGTVDVTRQIIAPRAKEVASTLEDQSRLLNDIFEKLDRGYLQYTTENGNILYWVMVTATRLVIGKLTLLIYLPVLFSSPSEDFSDEIRNKLLVSAIEVAEYNHALNSEEQARQWRWIYQTYTHWYAIVYLLIEITRRPWSPIIERAWLALQSSWLIPTQLNVDKNLRIWVPLRKLMSKARRYREAELQRLRGDVQAVKQLELDDHNIPVPASSGPFPDGNSEELLREHWHSLVMLPAERGRRIQPFGTHKVGGSRPSIVVQEAGMSQPNRSSALASGHRNAWSQVVSQGLSATTTSLNSTTAVDTRSGPTLGQTERLSNGTTSTFPTSWSGGGSAVVGSTPSLWTDADPMVDVFAGVDIDMDDTGEIDWYDWLESAKDMEWNAAPNGASGS